MVKQLKLDRVTLAAHDASGPPAIDWALAQAERVAGLVLLNTYYCEMPTLRAPEAIWLFSTPLIRNIAHADGVANHGKRDRADQYRDVRRVRLVGSNSPARLLAG